MTSLKYVAGATLLALILAVGYTFPPPVNSVYNVVDFGAVGDGNPANAAVNTGAFQSAIAAASNPGAPGVVEVPPGNFVVNDGQIKVSTKNLSIRGCATMGANSAFGITSTLIGKGPGNTLEINAYGCSVKGLAFRSLSGQKGSDACIMVAGAGVSQVSVRDVHCEDPNIGISINIPQNQGGEYWIRDVLVQGKVGVAGISVRAGGGTAHISHTIMFADNPPPPYGVVVMDAGELNVNDGCDIINMGTCLAIVPGLDGTKDQQAVAISVSQCLFDSPTGQGGVYIHPTNRAYVLKATFTDCWASTATNPGNTNGFTLDGNDSQPLLFKSIQNVKFVGCTAKSFRGHCGWYCRGVDCLSLIGCTAGDCFNGMQFAAGCTNLVVTNNSCGNFVPPSVPGAGGGNQAYGIYFESGLGKLICTGNMLTGNAGGLFNQQPNPGQVIGQNVQ